MDIESFPVGMLIPSSETNSLISLTAVYNRLSSPLFLAGHIQLALKETPFIPCVKGANTKLVKASATDNRDPAPGLIKAAAGA